MAAGVKDREVTQGSEEAARSEASAVACVGFQKMVQRSHEMGTLLRTMVTGPKNHMVQSPPEQMQVISRNKLVVFVMDQVDHEGENPGSKGVLGLWSRCSGLSGAGKA